MRQTKGTGAIWDFYLRHIILLCSLTRYQSQVKYSITFLDLLIKFYSLLVTKVFKIKSKQ